MLYTHQAAPSYMMVALRSSAATAVLMFNWCSPCPNIRLSEIGIHIDRCLSDKKGRENHNQEYISRNISASPRVASVNHLLRLVVLPIPVMFITIPNPPRAERAARRSSVRMISGTNFVPLDNHIQRELHEGSPVLLPHVACRKDVGFLY